MRLCQICGAEISDADENCKFEVPVEEAPWINDYHLMAKDEMKHQEHQLMVARWNLHHKDAISDKVFQWAKDIIKKATQ